MATVLQDIRDAAHKSHEARRFRWQVWRPHVPGVFKQGTHHYSVSIWCSTCGEKRRSIRPTVLSEIAHCTLCGGAEPVAVRVPSFTAHELFYEA